MKKRPYTNQKGPAETLLLPKTDYLVSTRRHKPYSAGEGSRYGMTEKERTVRAMARTASYGSGFGGGNSAFSTGYGFTSNAGNTYTSQQGNFHSMQLSVDFLELPQSIPERIELYRHIYNSDEIVAQAIDLLTEIPLSKIRLSPPKPATCPAGFDSPADYGQYIQSRFVGMNDNLDILQQLHVALHHFWLEGAVGIFAEDTHVELPKGVGQKPIKVDIPIVLDNGEVAQEGETIYQSDPVAERAYYAKHYKGWGRLVILTLDQLDIQTMNVTKTQRVRLLPSTTDKAILEQAEAGDEAAAELINDMPEDFLSYLEGGGPIPLNSDPEKGSFVYILHNRKFGDNSMGQSILNRCLRSLNFRDKLRQTQTQIASRAMTPKRVVWGEDLGEAQVDDLRAQVDLALVDPDYSIVTNYEVHWDDIGSRDRLLDLQSEYDRLDKLLYIGLGVTESIMSGEALYSGDRLKLSIMNDRFLLLRERIQDYVHNYLFKPVARRMGFVEYDKWGQEVVLYPRLSFNRQPLRDSQDLFDIMWNLYQKGSLPVDCILEMLNFDGDDIKSRIEKDMMSVNDSTFNEVLRASYGDVGRVLVEKTDLLEKLAAYLKLKIKEDAPAEDESRF